MTNNPPLADLEDVFNMPVEDLPIEVTIPAGTYHFRVRAVSDKPESNKMLLALTVVDVIDCTDEGEYEAWQDEKQDDAIVFLPFRGQSQRARAAQLRTFAIETGLEHTKETVGHEFIASVVYDANKRDPRRPWQRLRDFKSLSGDGKEE